MTRRWQVIVLLVLALCVCIELVGIAVIGNSLLSDPPEPTTVALPATPALPTRTMVAPATQTPAPAPTFTLVIQPGTPLPPLGIVRTPTRTNPYDIFVATPTTSLANSSVTYETRLTVKTYDVKGKSLNEIANALDANALIDPHEPHLRFYARTDWYLSTQWFYQPTARGCQLESAQVSVAITMTLPVLITGDAPPDVQKRWNDFVANTIAHENEHVRLVYSGAREYQRDLANFPIATNCNLIRTQLDDVFKKHFQKIDRANVEYDARTKHGETQGAVFP